MMLNPLQLNFDHRLRNQKEITIMSTQEQLHSSHRGKIKRGLALSLLTMLVFGAIVSDAAKADAVTSWSEIAIRVTTPPAANLAPPYQSRIYAMTHAAIHDAPVFMTTGSPPMNLGPGVNSSFNKVSPALSALARIRTALGSQDGAPADETSGSNDENPDQVLEWNQIFIDTLIATGTANSSSQRLGAIVHTAIFDAYNGIKRRY